MNTTIQWADLWTNDLKRWEQNEYLRKERVMMMESECTKVLLSSTKFTKIYGYCTPQSHHHPQEIQVLRRHY